MATRRRRVKGDRRHQHLTTMTDDLHGQLQASQQRERLLKRKLAEQRKEILALRTALVSALSDKSTVPKGCDRSLCPPDELESTSEAGVEAESESTGNLSEEDENDELDLEEDGLSIVQKALKAIRDDEDGVYRCAKCMWEVVEGVCQSNTCGAEHLIPEGDDFDDEDNSYRIVSTEYEPVNPDRRLAPRGNTPLQRIGRIKDTDIPQRYSGSRKNEYRELLKRGATGEMCEHFELEFSTENGIVAWATDEIFDGFAGPAMESGHLWKIYLGRRIELETYDLDGDEFIENLLEEVLLYPLLLLDLDRPGEKWETVQETPGVWATQPVVKCLREENVPPYPDSPYGMDEEESASYVAAQEEKYAHACDETLVIGEVGVPDGPVIRTDRYDTEEDELASDGEIDDAPGAIWPRNDEDAVWNSDEAYDSENSDGSGDEKSQVESAPEFVDARDNDDINEEEQDTNSDSEADADELFSGDEMVIRKPGRFY
ncbi:hypothetical protein DFH11DRAFT_1639694 [Phellopilus nigrolimitatus]|nr:hypothetical protein DFH11DRAFT_1639694 [Phellopilus nigrolimitatus]